ncbi:nicotinate-nicotinamide nucleotide adenylyltransferase [Parasalinivibrio latis]|uniref:nicotinate-nicotinamide nucleotide adenylyltransferase n=1 Tax=Parasalinivibrio latis TaxID=2952610 RepID=UPI0030E3D08E
MPQKVAVFGSAFNPPSLGHKSIVDRLNHFDQVLLVPSIAHAWGKSMPDFGLRCEWVEAFIKDLAQENVRLCRVEEEMYTGEEAITTYALLDRLTEDHPDATFTFVLGPDNFLNFSKFYKAEEILSRWSVLACPETVKIRSTKIREYLASGQDISEMTTPSVAGKIQLKQK